MTVHGILIACYCEKKINTLFLAKHTLNIPKKCISGIYSVNRIHTLHCLGMFRAIQVRNKVLTILQGLSIETQFCSIFHNGHDLFFWCTFRDFHFDKECWMIFHILKIANFAM